VVTTRQQFKKKKSHARFRHFGSLWGFSFTRIKVSRILSRFSLIIL
jgi:hypothetical protein